MTEHNNTQDNVTVPRELLRQALMLANAVDRPDSRGSWKLTGRQLNSLRDSLREALEQPAVEPTCKQNLQVHKPTGWAAPKDQYAVPVLFNPYTGEPRDVRDVQSDPQGVLIVPPGQVEMLAAPKALEQPVGEPAKLDSEWTPCMKLPVVVHVRNQRDGEQHVSTREGITPVKPDDLIMRGVSGGEYPIGRAIFEQTYTLDVAAPQAQPPRIGPGMTVEQTLEQWGHDLNNPMTPEQQSDWVKQEREFVASQKQQPQLLTDEEIAESADSPFTWDNYRSIEQAVLRKNGVLK